MPQVRYFMLALALIPSGTLVAQNPTSGAGSDDHQTVIILMQQVKALQQETAELREKVRALESGQMVTAQSPATSADSHEVPVQVSAQITAPAAPTAPSDAPREAPSDIHEVRGIQWKGFGEADYKVLDQRRPETGAYGFVPGSAGNFYTGDFDLFLSSRLNDKAYVIGDVALEEGDAQSFKIDLRQALLKYDVNDHLRISFGRYQTDIGYYNWAFRSAAWMQTSADRPLVMEYASNGGLLPTQAVGVSLTGLVPSGKLGLNYVAEYGSSDTIRPDINGSGLLNDENDGNHVLLGLFARPDAIRGLQIGGSYFHDKISDSEAGPSIRYAQTIVNGYVVYISHSIEFLNEVFLIRHSLIGGARVFNTPAFYSQFSRKVGPIRPFVRYQYVNASSDTGIFNDVLLRYGPSFGVRYDLNNYIAFKAQLDHTVRKGLPDLNGLHLQAAFAF
jgi:hypothetical protein